MSGFFHTEVNPDQEPFCIVMPPPNVTGQLHMGHADRWVISRYQATVAGVTRFLEAYELGEAARVLYEFIWSEFCDWYIELAKPRLYGKTTPEDKVTAQHVLSSVLKGTLELLHPFMPFITEEIWQHLPARGVTIMRASWPAARKELIDPEAENEMGVLMEVTKAVRHIRSEMNVLPGRKAEVLLAASEEAARAVLEKGIEYIKGLANAEIQLFPALKEVPEQAAHAVTRGVEVFVPLKGLIDVDKEVARLQKELASVEKDLSRVRGKLGNQGFLGKAPAGVVEKERAKEEELSGKQSAIRERLAMLAGGAKY